MFRGKVQGYWIREVGAYVILALITDIPKYDLNETSKY